MSYSEAFESAVNHAMIYEVGGFWKLTPDVELGLIGTPQHRKACGYTIDPTDAGGETKFGVAKNANPDLDIATLTWEQAKDVYYARYWTAGHCDELLSRVSVLHFDGSINHGVGRASKFLQSAANVAPVDGVIGQHTIATVNSIDEIELCNKICDLREQFYRNIVKAKPNQVKYIDGWLRRINEMRDFTTDPASSF